MGQSGQIVRQTQSTLSSSLVNEPRTDEKTETELVDLYVPLNDRLD